MQASWVTQNPVKELGERVNHTQSGESGISENVLSV